VLENRGDYAAAIRCWTRRSGSSRRRESRPPTSRSASRSWRTRHFYLGHYDTRGAQRARHRDGPEAPRRAPSQRRGRSHQPGRHQVRAAAATQTPRPDYRQALDIFRVVRERPSRKPRRPRR
jgi:hypothetical protein